MKGVLWLVLALSLLFNIFFAAGYVEARARARVESGPTADPMPQLVAEQLQLGQDQTRVFESLRARQREEGAEFEDAITLARTELVSELSLEEPDIERVREIVSRTADLHGQRRLAQTRRFSQFLGVLSPEQCRRLGRRVRGRPHGPGGRRESLTRRFDHDGDGVLNDEERAEAQAHIEARHREREDRREAMLERFDANDDGHLDREERRALREWMDENRPPPGPGPGSGPRPDRGGPPPA